MKRITKIAFAILLVCLIPTTTIKAQDKKAEQRIKIVIADKSGTKIELDTLLKDSSMPDTIIFKDGRAIYIGKHDGMSAVFAHVCSDKGGYIFVTDTSDKEGDTKLVRKVRIISGDSVKIIHEGEGDKIIIVKEGTHFAEGRGGKIMAWASTETDSKGERVIYINEGTEGVKDCEKVFEVTVNKDDTDESSEKTKYILAKDGMVISIEGNDEVKVKDLVKAIESKLEVKSEETVKKPVVKEEVKKTVKK